MSDQYDANGNTVVGRESTGAQVADRYDFENRLINRQTTLNNQPTTISLRYDGDGNRVAKTVGGVTTYYLVDDQNPTGYAQVLEELSSITPQPPILNRVYTYGLDLIAQDQLLDDGQGGLIWFASFYGYDGHGSVRFLTDVTGQLTDTYDYDAFGNLIAQATIFPTPTPNAYLYAGEQFDADLALYYNRARYLNTDSGRFWTRDQFEGFRADPLSLHTYLYADAEPVGGIDPSGFNTIGEMSMVQRIQGIIHSGIQQNFRLIIRKGSCELVEMGLGQAAEFAIAEAGLYLFEHAAAGRNLAEALGKARKPYAGQSERAIAERIKEHGKRVRKMLATFKVEGASLDEAEQWLIDTVKEAQKQDMGDALGRSNPDNQLANRRNQVKKLIGKALPMCK